MSERREKMAEDAAGQEARGRREPGDDFFCLRFQVWYPSFDCALRTKFETAPCCARCDQGRFNHRRHAAALRGVRFRLHGSPSGDRVREA